jgi:hypothetical protein
VDSGLLPTVTGEKPNPEKYWLDLGKNYYERTKSLLKQMMKSKPWLLRLPVTQKTDDEKIASLFDFCRTKIKTTKGLTAEERAKLKENKSPSDTLKHGIGTEGISICMFAALAKCIWF